MTSVRFTVDHVVADEGGVVPQLECLFFKDGFIFKGGELSQTLNHQFQAPSRVQGEMVMNEEEMVMNEEDNAGNDATMCALTRRLQT